MFRARAVLTATIGSALLGLLLVGANRIIEQRTLARADSIVAEFMDAFGMQVEQSLEEAGAVLDGLAAAGYAGCSESLMDKLGRVAVEHPQLLRIGYLDDMEREVCGHGRGAPKPERLAALVPLGEARSFEIVGVEGTRFRGLRIRRQVEGTPVSVAVTVPAVAAGPAVVPPLARRYAHLRIASAEGVVLWQVSDGRLEPMPGGVEFPRGPDRTTAERRIPPYGLVFEASVPTAVFFEANEGLVSSLNLFAALGGLILIGFAVFVAGRPPKAGHDLRGALDRGEFIAYYQPVIDLAHGRLAGCEMLARRRLPNGEIVMPADFIALAEKSGLALPMTRALMQRCRDDLAAAYSKRPDLKVSINLFEAHFETMDLLADVEGIFGGSGIGYGQLVFEITERQPLKDLDRAEAIIRRLQRLGAQVALDDAGTGHAGLAYLQKLGIDVLKIDKLFVDVIGASDMAPIVDTLNGLGHRLGMTVIAEGVENFEQVRYLRSLGVDFAQGYVFAPPLPAKSFLTLVEAMTPGADGAVPALEAGRPVGREAAA